MDNRAHVWAFCFNNSAKHLMIKHTYREGTVGLRPEDLGVGNPLSEPDPMDRIWTIPNVISYLRVVLLLPLGLGLIVSENYGWSLVVLTVLGSTDWLDGYLARRLNQQSRLGKELDPVADRASVLLVALTLVATGVLPWILFILIFVVDMTLLLLGVAWFGGYPQTHVNIFGKLRTVLLLVGLPMLILAAALHSDGVRVAGLIITSIGVVVHWVAGATYVGQMVELRRDRRAKPRH